MIRRMKYQGVARMAEWMAGEMLRAAERELPGGYDMIVPVPMHRKRLRLRGANHAEALAEALSRRMGVPSVKALLRTADTPQQARLSAAARRKNLDGAFAALPSVGGRRVSPGGRRTDNRRHGALLRNRARAAGATMSAFTRLPAQLIAIYHTK